ncbi:MAG TPA: hypothetical protein VFJ50_01895, partial [Gemmatimonadales bacterium]|nr:hypothetical protein [Gemmatimonadales bacterium]
QYLADLRQHQANVAAFQAGAQQALAQTAQGITGLAGQDAVQLQGMANQQAAQQGVAPAGDHLITLRNQAAATRQALIGSFQAQQALSGAAANTYADTQARVVGPGQKLSALAQAAGRTRDVQKQVTGLKAEEGAFNQQFRDTSRQDEFKNVLAAQTLGLNQTKAAADAASKTPAAVAATAGAKTEGSTAAKYGYSLHDWRMLGPNGRRRVIDAAKSKPADSVYTSGPFAGRKKSEVDAMSGTERQRLVDEFNKQKGKGKGQSGKGPAWQTQQKQSDARSQVASLKSYAQKAKAGQPFVAGHAPQTPASRQQAAQKIQQAVAAPDDPILLTAALDAAYDGHLSPATVRALIAAGYKPSLIAQALHVPTAGQQSGRGSNIPPGKI